MKERFLKEKFWGKLRGGFIQKYFKLITSSAFKIGIKNYLNEKMDESAVSLKKSLKFLYIHLFLKSFLLDMRQKEVKQVSNKKKNIFFN